MSKFSSFSSYSKKHGNKHNFTGCLISPDDSQVLRKHGFGLGARIGATGTISTDGTVDLVLSRKSAKATIRSYLSDGSVCFEVLPDTITLQSGTHIEKLTREHDIHISKLVVEARNDGVHLLSTDASHFGKSKKRNTSTRTRQTSSARAEIGTSVNDSVAATGTGRPLVSYITKTGDNYALLMSQTVVEGVGLAEGARVEIEQLDDGQIMIRRSKRHFTLDELLAGMTPDREHPLEDDAPRGEEKL